MADAGRPAATVRSRRTLRDQMRTVLKGGRERASGDARPRVTAYVVLLRGINVGGRNKVPMAPLRALLEEQGYANVSTYIASGNVILSSDRPAAEIKREIEEVLPKTFRLDSELVAVLVPSRAQLRAVVANKPDGFGEHPETYHSD